jgi:hypothetical protein
MTFGKRGAIQQAPPNIIPPKRHGEGRSFTWLLSFAFGSGIALCAFVVFWWAKGLGYATMGAIVLFCTFTAMFAVGELNVRAVVRTIRLVFRGDFRGMFRGILFIVLSDIAILGGTYFGYVLSALARLERFSGIVENHDVARAVFFSVPVILICMGMLAVLNRFVTGNTEATNSQP